MTEQTCGTLFVTGTPIGNLSDFSPRAIEALESAVESTQLLMRHGDATYLEVLTAQQNLLNAELAESSDRYAEIQGIISLYYALGGGTY